MNACAACSCDWREIEFSVAQQAWVCLDCYFAAPVEPVAGVKPCPACGEPLGGRYGDDRLCWPCFETRHPEPAQPHRAPRRPDWQEFRERTIGALDRVEAERFVYLDEDRFVHICPVCQSGVPEGLSVEFHAKALRAEIRCSRGCPDDELAQALGIEVVA